MQQKASFIGKKILDTYFVSIMIIEKLAQWNGLVYGSDKCLVYLLNEFLRENKTYQEWAAIYDIAKKLDGSTAKIPRHAFLDSTKGKYVFIAFTCDKVDLYEDNAAILHLAAQYFDCIEDAIAHILRAGLMPQHFQYSWKVEYPLGG